ncbi:MAG TPA: histone H1 [Candidatus Tidjanibacter faecipullorum]|uniref:Histone H1 n=1 Tax=Candidatus Tidjanibacter faecipullorum TaxID=2838766 RepID=A0A9D2ILY3_9BACT|nr:histone H1 [Candidatus Tidjanibacter faecipullorum]
MEKLLNDIKAKVEEFIKDADLQAEKGNKAAGMRARKASLELEKMLKEFRKVSIEASK